MPPPIERVLDLARSAGILRASDLNAHGIARQYLIIAQQHGLLERRGRGLYVLAGRRRHEMHLIAEAARRVRRGVVCLDSALRLHGLRDGPPREVWLAIPEKDRRPRATDLPLRICRFSKDALAFGVQLVTIEGVPVQVFSPAKTIADCFKYRHKIGSDSVIEILRDALRDGRVTPVELEAAAGVCRVRNVLQPYLELARSALVPTIMRKGVASTCKARRERTA